MPMKQRLVPDMPRCEIPLILVPIRRAGSNISCQQIPRNQQISPFNKVVPAPHAYAIRMPE